MQVLAMVAWPFVVIAGARFVGTRGTAALVVLLLLPGLVRGAFGASGAGGHSLGFAAGAAAVATAAAVLDDARFLLAWPVLVSLALLVAFVLSLRGGHSIVERFARLQVSDLSQAEVAYCRTVTVVWCVFFVLNGSLAAALAISGQREVWAVYTGAVAYALMGILFGAEYVVRKIRFPRPRGAPP